MKQPLVHFILALGFLLAASTYAVEIDRYAWEFPEVAGIAGADDLKAELQQEVQLILDAGHLAPLYLSRSDQESNGYLTYQEPGRIIATLAWAYPHLTPVQQVAVTSYVQAEIAAGYGPWGTYPLSRTAGAQRERHQKDTWWYEQNNFLFRPRVQTIYGLWLYGHRTGDWTMVRNNWSSLKTFYTDNQATQATLYGAMSAHIAMARLADRFGDTAMRATALSNLQTQLDAGLTFSEIELNASSRPQTWSSPYGSNPSMYDSRQDDSMHRGWVFLNLSPEMGRYLDLENPALRTAVLTRHTSGKELYPFWWLYQANYFNRSWTGDEGSGLVPEVFGMLYPLERWVVRTDAATLRSYFTSAPTGIGDCYWLEGLAQTIEAHGVATWTDVRTGLTSDTVPPAAVTDLALFASTTTSLSARWTAPGDDGTSGTASIYDFRYATAPLSEATWATATPVAGEPAPLSAGTVQTMTISGLAPGTAYYVALKTLDDTGNSSPLSNVASAATTGATVNIPPTVSIASPANGATFTSPANITLSAVAGDSDGTVSKVEFFQGTSKVGEVTAPPYSLTLNALAAGTYTLTALATDNAGATASSAVTITVTAGTGGQTITNLLTNGNFETGAFDGWSLSGSPTVVTMTGHGGSATRVALLPNAALEQGFATEVGKTYKATAWIKIISESGSDWGGFVVSVTEDRNWIYLARTPLILSATHGTNWFKVALTFTATTTYSRIRPEYWGGSGRAMVVAVDDLTVFAKGVNQPPTVSASLSPTLISALPAIQSFEAHADDPDGAITSVLWEFGDGSRAMTDNASRRVGVPGSYFARVTVTDDEGAVTTQIVSWSAASSGYPTLSITNPAASETTVSSATLDMSGSAGGTGLTVYLSSDRGWGKAATGTTSWGGTVSLQPGWNQIIAQAKDAGGRVITAERRVRYVPASPLAIAGMAESAASIGRFEPIEITFSLDNSAATNPHLPYDAAPLPGLEWVDGVTVDALFTPDNWTTVYRRPAYLNQRYDRQLKGNMEWLYPNGNPVWTVRFSPPVLGTWQYRIEAHEARGSVQSAPRSFTVTASPDPRNHGPLRVSTSDTRYFEHADATPFISGGHGIGGDPKRRTYDLEELFSTIGLDNQKLFRLWISGDVWSSAWWAWNTTTGHDGTVPQTGLTIDSAYNNGLVSIRMDNANWVEWQGWLSGYNSIVPGRQYTLRVRWRTEGVTGPVTSGKPYGVAVRFVGWPDRATIQEQPLVVAHVSGDTPWHVAEGTFTAVGSAVQAGDFLANPALVFENATGGAAYVDEISLREVMADGSLGPELMRNAKMNAHSSFDPRGGAQLEAIMAAAASRDKYLRLVISEKQEYIINRIGPTGKPAPAGGQYNATTDTAGRRLHQYQWRHLMARLGAYRSVHSWELANEEAPVFGEHFRMTADLASMAQADGNPHLASTSTWSTLAEDAWKNPGSAPINHTDFHCYVRGTGWIEPREELANDSARFFHEYSLAARSAGFGKPVVWGEMGIDGVSGANGEDPDIIRDTNGVWLHKLVWAQSGPGGVYPLYWYTNSIYSNNLSGIFGAWLKFMAGIPLNNGRYQDAAATASAADLRIIGQKDTLKGAAHLWIDNRQHTWKVVVNGTAVTPLSGTIQIAMGAANATYLASWYHTGAGMVSSTQSLTADTAGVVTLTVTNLATDTAVRLDRTTPLPAITSFTPISGSAGTAVTIRGANLGNATALNFNGVAATIVTNTATAITTKVPAGATTGPISITTAGGAATSATGFTVPSPTISSFTPASGSAGTAVTIRGANLGGATVVTFNGIPATIVTNTTTAIATKVPAAATTGSLRVTTAAGTATSATSFTVPSPTITSFTPATGGVGAGVTITGTNFTGTTSVKFNGVAAPFVVVSATAIATSVPSGATSGPLTVMTYGGLSTSSAGFTVGAAAAVPRITGFTPTSGGTGATVTVTGSNLVGATALRFNGIPVSTFTVLSNSALVTAAPPGATTGPLTVTAVGGTGVSAGSFTVSAVAVAPTISSFSPASGRAGTDITVSGANLGGVTAARLGGIGAVFRVRSGASLVITVPTGAATGALSVTTDGGTAISAGSFTVIP